ncbi:MAG TPA: SDR family oxidoreductase [Acidimicrobiales bacterium]|jgi:NAD(P)-dependent dehydrogenase (short-subunit alcohol dehydrogenase family)|nr:SDR family oxidoreductase [Acidimicrobiales bacterium]
MSERPVVVVTGGSAGVGRATARAFARKGLHVGLLARGTERLEAACREVEAAGVRCLGVPTDVADAAAVEEAAARIERDLGPINVWVNNAMTSVFSPVAELDADEVRRVTEVTYLGSVNGILAALRRMRPRDRGTILQVGSALAYRAIPLQASYCGSKFAIRGFVDSLRCELLHDGSGVRVTTVHMPALNTPQFGWVRSRLPRHPQPVPPIYEPEVAARAIVWAADHPRREMWVGYPTVGAIVANAVVPGLLDRYLARTNFDAQQTDRPVSPDRPDNLCDPVPGHQAAHGIFDGKSKSRSLQNELNMHRGVAAGAASAAALVVAARRRRK